MKRIWTLILAAGMLLGAATGASAVDFKAKGQWMFGFGMADNNFISNYRNVNRNSRFNGNDQFAAQQRLRLQLEAVASEALSGTVQFEMGDTIWGKNRDGGALGTDGRIVEVRQAYIDWVVPQTDLRFRMGLQEIALPNKAGGSAVLDGPVAGVVGSYRFNENVGLTALWMRPYNDNFTAPDNDPANYPPNYPANYLDNLDLFALTVPVKLEGFEITPWAMFGIMGRNTLSGYNSNWTTAPGGGNPNFTLGVYPAVTGPPNGQGQDFTYRARRDYGTMFWAGLPIAITAWDPLHIELDINYGFVESMGTYTAVAGLKDRHFRSNVQREGWLAKGLIEYKMEWGTPGIFGWYASGDSDSPEDGSQRMPSIVPKGNFTSWMGDGNLGWGPGFSYYDRGLSYAGTWGVGLQVRDVSFLEDLKHTFRVAYWGGTNSPSMVDYMADNTGWYSGLDANDGPYLTTTDGMLEFNLVNSYKIYENLELNVELGYIANFIDNNTWSKAHSGNNTTFNRQDAWKAQAVFVYSF